MFPVFPRKTLSACGVSADCVMTIGTVISVAAGVVCILAGYSYIYKTQPPYEVVSIDREYEEGAISVSTSITASSEISPTK